MSPWLWTGLALGGPAVDWMLYVTGVVVRDPWRSGAQKFGQVLVVRCVPVLRTALVHSIHRQPIATPRPRSSQGYPSRDPYTYGGGDGGT